MMHGDLTGFYGAPVTYALSMTIGAASAATILLDHGRLFLLNRKAVLKHWQWWKLVSHQLPFQHGIAVSFGIYVLFQFRVLERQMGSRKFGSYTLFTLALTSLIEYLALQALPTWTLRLPAGPYAVLGFCSVFFYRYIPKLHPQVFSLFKRLHFSDKSTTYFLLVVLLGHDVRSLYTFVPGVFAGWLLSSTICSRFRVPSVVCSLFELFSPLFEVVPASVAALERQRRLLEAQRRLGLNGLQRAPPAPAPPGQGFRDQLLPGRGGLFMPPMPGAAPPAPRAPPAASPPSEAAIEQLVALGFDRERSIAALRSTNNNVEAAANRLLNE